MPNRNNTVSRNRHAAAFLPSKPAPRPKISRQSPLSSARWPQFVIALAAVFFLTNRVNSDYEEALVQTQALEQLYSHQ
ncbi:MAG: hypothetical protein ACLUB5_00935 [Bifidobacterium dentium]